VTERRGRLQHRRRPETEAADLDDSTPPISAASAAGIFDEGSRFGAYVIGPCIGHGGMARIYRAEHEGLRRQVALKVLTEGVAQGTEGRARFMREARIAAAIKHPNVVNIFDIGVENHIPYLVMELLVGQDLESLLGSHGALSEHTIVDIIVPVVAGLVAVHDAGVVHRDLKPGNIFLSKGANEEVEPKLLDFGISRSVNAGEKMRLTSTQGLLMGTPLYMSPEALLGTDMTPGSDQYSLGVMLYECATGVNPFMADNVAETARRVTTGQYVPIADQAIRPSRRLQSIIERTMSLDPKDRYPDMRALGQDLLMLAGQRTRITWGLTFGTVAAAARARNTRDLEDARTALARTRAPKSSSKREKAWPFAAAACVGIVAVAALSTWSSRHPGSATPGSPVVAASPGLGTSTVSTAPGLRSDPALAASLVTAAPVVTPPGGLAPEGTPQNVVQHLEPERSPGAPTAAAPQSTLSAAATALVPGFPGPAAPAASTSTLSSAPPVAAARAPSAEPPAPARLRAPAPVAVQPPRAKPAEPPQRDDVPDWIIERKDRSRANGPSRFQIGTNEAPIFD
jgi:eukaryotic-like serine/threonine-protein kinase